MRIEKSGLADEIKEKTFKNFKTDTDWQRYMKETALAYGKAYFDTKENGGKFPWFFVAGNPGCVDADTEYFVGSGWKRIADYDGGLVMEYDPVTKSSAMVYPLRYIKKDADSLYMIKSKRGSVNQVLSSDHSFAYVTSKGNMQKKPFSEVMEIHNCNAQGFYGKIETAFCYGGKGIDLSDNEIRLMCAVIADGSFLKGQRKCHINVKKDRKKERLRQLLDGKDYKEYRKSNGFSDFRFYAPREEKVFSGYWYGCSNRQLKVIVDEVFNWDGSRIGKRKFFFSTVKENADFIQFALASCGIRSTIRIDARKNRKVCYVVIASSGNSYVRIGHGMGRKAEITKYIPKDGKQYCFTVPSGYLVLRREGRIFITGNCGKTHLCTALCGALLNRGVPVSYMQWVTESRKLRGYAFEPEAFDSIIEPYIDIDVLYIDDLFKQPAHKEINVSDAEGKILFEILNQRYFKNKATIISTEWYLDDELIPFDDGVFSRVMERCRNGDFVLSIERGKDKNYRLFKHDRKKKEGNE